MRKLFLGLLLAFSLGAQSRFTMDWMASITTWDTGFHDLQTPGWVAVAGGLRVRHFRRSRITVSHFQVGHLGGITPLESRLFR